MVWRHVGNGLRYTIGTLALAVPFRWSQVATDGFTTWPHKDTGVSKNIVLDDSTRDAYTHQLSDRMVDVIGAYKEHNHQLELTEEEFAIAGEKYQHYEMLDSLDDPSGCYGAAFRDMVTGKVILAFAGADFKAGGKKLRDDADDILMCTTGGQISYLESAQRFAKQIDEKYGINYLTGHSLGGYVALYLKGMGLCPKAECFSFESPGVTNIMVRNAARLGHCSRQEVRERLRDHTVSFNLTYNSFNTLGQQAGVALAMDNKPNNFTALWPDKHVYDEVVAGTAHKVFGDKTDGTSLIARTNDGKSGGPDLIPLMFLSIAALSFLPEIKKGKKKVDEALDRRFASMKEAVATRWDEQGNSYTR